MSQIEQPSRVAIELDEKDYAILRLVQENAKLTVREIASRIHLSPTPTHERIKRLEQHQVIRQYVALVDNRQVNRKVMVICQVALKEHDKQTAHAFVSGVVGFKEVVECYNVSGDYDFMLKILAESIESYHDFFINYLGEVKGIQKAKSIFVMDIIKDSHEVL